jgi:hypothetical protein
MAFAESLTVRILGDSSDLRGELGQVVAEIRGLRGELDLLSNVGEQIGRGFSRVTTSVRPLEQVSQLLGRIATQAQSLGRMPVMLNVQPALEALAQLSRMIQLVAAQLQALSLMVGGGGGGAGGGGGGPIRRFASGGLVTGPGGTDVIPALLTAGEFVLSRSAAQTLGTSFLEALNSVSPAVPSPPGVRGAGGSVHNTTNHFGGITIQVAEAARVNEIVRDLRLQGVRLRNRRG